MPDTVTGLTDNDNLEVLFSFLPDGWKEKAREYGALHRSRQISNAQTLLRVLLIHLAEGCSLRETVVRASKGGICQISSVALHKRLRVCSDWFRWMTQELMNTWVAKPPDVVFGDHFKIVLVDGTRVDEPGTTGSTWRIHYSVELPSLRCSEFNLTDIHKGETFCRFNVQPGVVLIGDRGYCSRKGIDYVLNHGGHVLVRVNHKTLPLHNEDGSVFNLLAHLRKLNGAKLGDWDVWVPHNNGYIRGRLCSVKKSKQATEKAQKAAKERARKDCYKVSAETLEIAGYFLVFCSLAREVCTPTTALEMYRGRWQIELVFKRLKTIIGLGHLPKGDPETAKSWLYGKLLIAFLIEAMIVKGETFFPWGYPLSKQCQAEAMPLA